MKIPLLIGACLGLVSGCSSVAPQVSAVPATPIPTTAALAIAAANLGDPLDGAKAFTHLAFVIDTSGSMRDPRSGKLWPVVTQAVVNVLATHPDTKWIQWIDTNGATRLGRGNEWIPYDRSTADRLVFMLESSESAGVSNPMPGLLKALKLPFPQEPNERIHICVIGDEFIAEISAALQAIDRNNPSDGNGGWHATISAVQLPTMIRFGGGTPNSALKFEALMAELTRRHGGTFRMLADLQQL